MSERNGGGRPWGLRLVALAIAVGLWIGVSLWQRDEVAERIVEATLSYVNKPRDVIILDQVGSARVRVSGPDREVRQLAPTMVQVQVDLAGRVPGVASIPLGPSNVRLPGGLEVLSVEPNFVQLELDREVTRSFRLRPEFTGEPAAGARVLGESVRITPPEAEVTGPAKVLNDLESLALSPISLDGHAVQFTETATVLTPHPLARIVRNPVVTVTIPMDLGPEGGGAEAPGGSR